MNNYENVLLRVARPDYTVFQCICELRDYSHNIGVYHYLVQRLRSFNYSELEFHIPQLVQILVSYETDSLALFEFLLEYSGKFPHFCLITFWNLQAYVFELKNDPNTSSFHIVRNFINQLQNIMFNQDILSTSEKSIPTFRENLSPSLVICGSLAASFAIAGLNEYAKPLVILQGKQQKSFLFKLANFHKSLTENLTMKNKKLMGASTDSDDGEARERNSLQIDQSRKSESSIINRSRSLNHFSAHALTDDGFESADERSYNSDYSLEKQIKINTRIVSKKSLTRRSAEFSGLEGGLAGRSAISKSKLASHLMPDLPSNRRDALGDEVSITPLLSDSSATSLNSLEQQEQETSSHPMNRLRNMLYDQKVKFLHVNYFKKETEFIIILQNISTKLSQVPKEARLTSLRAELSIINNTVLPAEIDIPQLFPTSSQQNKKFHKILKLNVSEACVLNSAERVPFLLLIEYLSEETDFDPLSEHNRKIILNRTANEYLNSKNKRSIASSITPASFESAPTELESMEEADLGDMSVIAISNERGILGNTLSPKQSQDLHQNLLRGSNDEKTALIFDTQESKTPIGFGEPTSLSTKDLSTQMRIAAVMLQQLEKSGQNNSEQSAAIRARIIDSMKALQDKFENIDYQQIKEMNDAHGGIESDAGERKLENDFKLSEDWSTKKKRIRKASAHGHLKNWDLCSVIAKNGDDLPQEAFACQLIALISKIWRANDAGVWTKNMKIIVTSANTGLVETINNALSIHSIKKSLTEISVKSGENPKGKIASLYDYFRKVYGSEESERFRKAQKNFARSLAAYSIICYVLQIKDRHNGNIMIDNEGHIIHIDFGFLLSNSPGSVGFEAAPFKLTFEYIEVLGGLEGRMFHEFKDLCKRSFRTLRSNCESLINMVDLMQKDSSLPCFKNGAQTSVLLRQRLQLGLSDEECDTYVESVLITRSLGSLYTRLYDQFQLLTQGIYS